MRTSVVSTIVLAFGVLLIASQSASPQVERPPTPVTVVGASNAGQPVTIDGAVQVVPKSVEPFQFLTDVIRLSEGRVISHLFFVPEDRQLKIEYVGGRCGFGLPDQVHDMALVTIAGGAQVPHYLDQSVLAANAVALGGPVSIYAQPGSPVIFAMQRNFGGGDSFCEVSLSGQLLPA
jgi:hypothetical protein